MAAQINTATKQVHEYLKRHDLSLSLEKCEAIWFTRGRRKNIPPAIKINNHIIQYKSQVKYLGILLHQNLKWDSHINHTVNKAKKSLNILKSLCRVWWGADPNTLLTAFHALVTSHLDFGSIFIKPTNQKSLDKLDKVFYEGLRICLGCMKSTPRAALLAEAASTDLEHRRNILSTKFIARKVHIKDHPLIVELLKLRNKLILSPAFHSPLNRPYLISAIYNFFPYITNIYKSSNLPCYEIDFKILNNPIKIIDCGINKNDLMIREKFALATEKYKDNFIFIFTDA